MDQFSKKVEELLKEPGKLAELVSEAFKKLYARRGELVHVFEDLMLLLRLVKAWVVGEYKTVSRNTIFWAVLAIVYFVSPLDALPDILPGGFIDDIAFVAMVLKKIKEDLDKFRDWEKKA